MCEPSVSNIKEEAIQDQVKKEFVAPSQEERISALVDSVMKQGRIGKMVLILDDFENPYKSLQKAVTCAGMDLIIIRDTTVSVVPNVFFYVLKIDGEELGRGQYPNLQSAKRHLARYAIDRLFYTCFVIYRKAVVQTKPSRAHELLTDMDWINRGIFSADQECNGKILVCENIKTSETPGHELLDIPKILEEFVVSPKYRVLMLHVDLDFGSLLMVALRVSELGLKLTTSDQSHKTLIISKKITRMDVVKELLKTNGYDELYELTIPKLFQVL